VEAQVVSLAQNGKKNSIFRTQNFICLYRFVVQIQSSMSEAVIKELQGEGLSTRNVSKLTTFALRQELVHRDCLDIPEEKINHNSMLQRLIEDLVKQEAKVAEDRTSVAVDTAQQERDAAKALREQRKQEAIERSKARQAQKEYFETKKEANDTVAEKIADKAGEKDGEEEGEEGETLEEPETVDPFRTYKPSGRSRVHVS
jgi:hypothetical protein